MLDFTCQHGWVLGPGENTAQGLCAARSLSRVRLSAAPGTVARQAPLSTGFSRQEYWSGLPFPPLGDLPDPGIEPEVLMCPALAGRFFTTSAAWEAQTLGQKCLSWDERRI